MYWILYLLVSAVFFGSTGWAVHSFLLYELSKPILNDPYLSKKVEIRLKSQFSSTTSKTADLKVTGNVDSVQGAWRPPGDFHHLEHFNENIKSPCSNTVITLQDVQVDGSLLNMLELKDVKAFPSLWFVQISIGETYTSVRLSHKAKEINDIHLTCKAVESWTTSRQKYEAVVTTKRIRVSDKTDSLWELMQTGGLKGVETVVHESQSTQAHVEFCFIGD